MLSQKLLVLWHIRTCNFLSHNVRFSYFHTTLVSESESWAHEFSSRLDKEAHDWSVQTGLIIILHFKFSTCYLIFFYLLLHIFMTGLNNLHQPKMRNGIDSFITSPVLFFSTHFRCCSGLRNLGIKLNQRD